MTSMGNVEIVQGDILRSNAQTLVNTVNCVGIMGKGIALAFKKRFPDMFVDYAARCRAGEVRLGEPYLYRGLEKWVLNFPTKQHWRNVSRLEDIERGLHHLEQNFREWGVTSLAVPPLGCGNGELEWRVVGPLLARRLAGFAIPVELYAPTQVSPGQVALEFLSPMPPAKLIPAWVGIAEIVAAINRERYHAPVGRTALHKIGYFATVAGLPTGFHYERKSFGPWTANLKPAISRLVNNGVIREEAVTGGFRYRPGPGYDPAVEAVSGQLLVWHEAIERVTDLFMRLRSTRQAEVAATVHFTVGELERRVGRPTERQVFDEVRRWKARRTPPLRDVEIGDAIRHLNILGWLKVTPSADLPVEDQEFALA